MAPSRQWYSGYVKSFILLAWTGIANAYKGWHHGWSALAGLGGLGWPGLAGYGLGGLGWAGLGLGGLGLYGGSYLLPGMLSLLATPQFGVGIFPSLCLRVLLCKARLMVYGPVGLGAFVVGTGSGLIIGKLLGIRTVLNHFWPKPPKPRYPFEVKINGWRSGPRGWHGWTGWKPWRLKLRLPLFRRFRLHRTFPPPHHYDFHSYPPIKHGWSHKTYGTYSHEPESHGWDDATSESHVSSSGWKEGRGPVSSSYESTSSHVYTPQDDHGHTDIKYEGDQGYAHYSTDPEHSASEQSFQRYRKSSNDAVNVQDLLRAEVLKMKSDKYKPTSSKEEEAMLNDLFNEQFAKDIADTIQEGKLPEFKPIPTEEIDPLLLNETVTEPPKSKNSTESDPGDDLVKLNRQLADNLFSNVMNSIKNFNPLTFVPETIVSWLTGTEPDSVTSGSDQQRAKRGTGNEVNVDHITKSIVKDIKNLFSFISFLDRGQCLEKMVCEIHSRGREFTAQQIANSYEGNIITAFKIMESIMPDEQDAGVVKYREAARLGQKNEKPEICLKNYSGCVISTNRLIRLGSLIEGTPTQEDQEPVEKA